MAKRIAELENQLRWLIKRPMGDFGCPYTEGWEMPTEWCGRDNEGECNHMDDDIAECWIKLAETESKKINPETS